MTNEEKEVLQEQHCKDVGELSDGYHTFNQLYHQRAVLFACIVRQNKNKAWKSFKHSDGKYCFDSNGEWFIVGIDTPQGSYTYHYTKEYWDMFDCQELECGKEWDGHTEEDVTRLLSLEQQPCETPRTNLAETSQEDAISRAALLEELGEEPFNWNDSPEAIQEVRDYQWFRSLVENAPLVTPKQTSWPPVSERLPEKSGREMTNERAKEVLQEQINRYGRGYVEEGIEALNKAIEVLGQQSCEDCISRQAAIDAIAKLHPVETEYDCTLYDKLDVMYVLKDLPSVTPTVSKMKQDEDYISREAVKQLICQNNDKYGYSDTLHALERRTKAVSDHEALKIAIKALEQISHFAPCKVCEFYTGNGCSKQGCMFEGVRADE